MEQAAAGISPVEAGTPEFDGILQSQNGDTVLWVVLRDGRRVVAPAGGEVTHAVLSAGADVSAAGTAEINVTPSGYEGEGITNFSGHFEPADPLVEIGRVAFSRIGIFFPDESVWTYRW
jgi:hypothetical protein